MCFNYTFNAFLDTYHVNVIGRCNKTTDSQLFSYFNISLFWTKKKSLLKKRYEYNNNLGYFIIRSTCLKSISY